METKTPVSSELSRELSLFHLTMMGLGMMVGAGVFLGIGYCVHFSGSGGVLLTFAFNGVFALLTAMSYAELSSAVPRAGGAYNFARMGFGRGTSFMAGWMEWFASSVAGSLYSVTFALYTVRFFRILGWVDGIPVPPGILEKIVAVSVALFFLYINYRGASETGRIGAFFTLGQMMFLIFIAVLGFWVVLRDPSRLENFRPFLPLGWGKLLGTMGFTYVAFEGYEVIAQAGDEAIDPRRNLPKAMLYSVGIVTFTYVAVAFAAVVSVKGVGMPPWQWIGQFEERGFGEAVARLVPAGNLLLTIAVIFASTSALNATIYSATRASYALGRDGMLPRVIGSISRKRRTPWVALLCTGLILICVVTALPTLDVASSASIMFLFLFLLVNACVIKVRLNLGDELKYGFITPFFPLLPLLAIGLQIVLAVWLIHMSWLAWVVAPSWIGVGLLIYTFYSRSRASVEDHEIQVVEEERAPEGKGYRIMVAVANPDTALSLVRGMYAICGAKEARVELLHMVPVPEQVPLSDAASYMREGKEAIGEIMLYLQPSFPLSTTIRYCRNVARGILSAAREKRVNLLIMGWRGRRSPARFALGSTVDPVIERTPCNLVVFKNFGDQKYKRVLVPVAGGPNSAFALEIAGILADPEEGRITAFTVRSGRGEFDLNEFVENNMERIILPRDRIQTKTVFGDVIAGIQGELEDPGEGYDLVVLGSTRQRLAYQFHRESVPETIARRCVKPLAMVTASEGIRSWIKRWI